jgi:hypothetical protein
MFGGTGVGEEVNFVFVHQNYLKLLFPGASK